jgi:hypothetical protein
MTLALLRACEDSEERPRASARDSLSQENTSGSLGFWLSTVGSRAAVLRPLREYASRTTALVKRPMGDDLLISNSVLGHSSVQSEEALDAGKATPLEVTVFTLDSLLVLDRVRGNVLKANQIPEGSGDIAEVSEISPRTLFFEVAKELGVPVLVSTRLLLPGSAPRGVAAESALARRLFKLPRLPPLSAVVELAFLGLLRVYRGEAIRVTEGVLANW